MRSRKPFAVSYFSNWWMPSAVTMALMVSACVCLFADIPVSMFVLVGIPWASLLGVLAAAIVHMVRRRWLYGSANLIALPILAVISIFMLTGTALLATSGEDQFADKLTIPADIDIAEPLEAKIWPNDIGLSSDMEADDFQRRMIEALKAPGGEDAAIHSSAPSLIYLRREFPDILRRYLACSPCWRVFEEHGSVYATRRWMIGGRWHYRLHGYYGRFSESPEFQTRTTLGLSGRPWARTHQPFTRTKPGDTKRLALRTQGASSESHLVVSGDELAIEIMEESGARERRLTKAALVFMESEFRPLAGRPRRSTVERMLPKTGVRHGKPTMALIEGSQPGIYGSEIWANPREPGMVYLKAYEVTRNARLSGKQLSKYSNEYIGWSDDPKELFLSNTTFTIYEGDWGKPYAARFEVWFGPESGGPERKLMEKVFRIEGWQR